MIILKVESLSLLVLQVSSSSLQVSFDCFWAADVLQHLEACTFCKMVLGMAANASAQTSARLDQSSI